MGNFSKSKMYCLCTRCIIVNSVQVRSEFGKFAYTAICMRKCTLWSDNTCVFTHAQIRSLSGAMLSIININNNYFSSYRGLSWSYGSWIYNYLCNHRGSFSVICECILSIGGHFPTQNTDLWGNTINGRSFSNAKYQLLCVGKWPPIDSIRPQITLNEPRVVQSVPGISLCKISTNTMPPHVKMSIKT
jgi:hypothetical protein